MTYLFLLVILGQPDYTDNNFRAPPKHLKRVKKVYVHPEYSRKPDGIKYPTKEQMPRFDTKPCLKYEENHGSSLRSTN